MFLGNDGIAAGAGRFPALKIQERETKDIERSEDLPLDFPMDLTDLP